MAKNSRKSLLTKLISNSVDYVIAPCSDGCFDLYLVTVNGFEWTHSFLDFRSACEFVAKTPHSKFEFVSKIS